MPSRCKRESDCQRVTTWGRIETSEPVHVADRAFGVIDKATAQACEGVGNMRRSEAAKKDNITGNMFVDEIVSHYLPKLPGLVVNQIADKLGETENFLYSLFNEWGGKTVDEILNDPRYTRKEKNALQDVLDIIDEIIF